MKLLLDTGVLGRLCHPNQNHNRLAVQRLAMLLDSGEIEVLLPEIADYELRRKLLHLIAKGQATHRSIDRLDAFAMQLDYLPLSTAVMRRAAEMWADSRGRGQPTASDVALDGYVILAAQAESVGGIVATDNPKHLQRYVVARGWSDL